MYAALRSLPLPSEPLARLCHAATLLREQRGDGHIAALIAHRIDVTESHFLGAVTMGMRGADSGRLHHRPPGELAAIENALGVRGLIDAEGRITAGGRETKDWIEALTDELAQPPYDTLTENEWRVLVAGLDPIIARLTSEASA